MKSLTSDEFFKKIAVNAGVSDLKTVRDIYYGMVRTMSQELRGGRQKIKLPDWGEFLLKVYKSRITLNVNTGKPSVLPPKPLVKFIPDRKVKAYFYALGEDGTVIK
jgi:nucleoid DNA-binding protein